jgi:hypothetical protein
MTSELLLPEWPRTAEAAAARRSSVEAAAHPEHASAVAKVAARAASEQFHPSPNFIEHSTVNVPPPALLS